MSITMQKSLTWLGVKRPLANVGRVFARPTCRVRAPIKAQNVSDAEKFGIVQKKLRSTGFTEDQVHELSSAFAMNFVVLDKLDQLEKGMKEDFERLEKGLERLEKGLERQEKGMNEAVERLEKGRKEDLERLGKGFKKDMEVLMNRLLLGAAAIAIVAATGNQWVPVFLNGLKSKL